MFNPHRVVNQQSNNLNKNNSKLLTLHLKVICYCYLLHYSTINLLVSFEKKIKQHDKLN